MNIHQEKISTKEAGGRKLRVAKLHRYFFIAVFNVLVKMTGNY